MDKQIRFTDIEDLGEPVERVRHLLDVVTEWTNRLSYDDGLIKQADSSNERTQLRLGMCTDVRADLDTVQAVLQCCVELTDKSTHDVKALVEQAQKKAEAL